MLSVRQHAPPKGISEGKPLTWGGRSRIRKATLRNRPRSPCAFLPSYLDNQPDSSRRNPILRWMTAGRPAKPPGFVVDLSLSLGVSGGVPDVGIFTILLRDDVLEGSPLSKDKALLLPLLLPS